MLADRALPARAVLLTQHAAQDPGSFINELGEPAQESKD
jgi:hypothetical protein